MYKKLIGLVGLSLLVTACAGANGEWTPPDNTDDKTTPSKKYLDIVGNEYLSLASGQTATLSVSYSLGRTEPLDNETISFEVKGYAGNSALSSYFVSTSSNGVAKTVLTAGPYTTSFQVEARSPDGQAVLWSVVVKNGPGTTIDDATKFEGSFNLVSQFDVDSSFEGSNVATALNVLYNSTNDADDPARFLVDTIIDAVPNDAIRDVAVIVKPSLYALVNAQLADKAAELTSRFKEIASKLSTITREFTIQSTLKDGDPISVDEGGLGTSTYTTTSQRTHILEGLSWVINGQPVSYSFDQLGLDNPQTQVTVTFNNGSVNTWNGNGVDQPGNNVPSSSYFPSYTNRVYISEHTFKFNSGAFLMAAMDSVILPQVAGTTSMADLIRMYVDCDSIGSAINDVVGLGGDSFWQATCDLGLAAGGALIEQQIAKIGGLNSTITLKGDASLVDTNNDKYYDSMTNGRWYGTLSFDDNAAQLNNGYSSFVGNRIY